MPDSDLPILIAGAGCAGLSLAVQLQLRGYPGKVVIVDPRTEFTRDRTWCHYVTQPHAFEACISHQWNDWCVKTASGDSVARSSRYPYAQISSDRFYDYALSVIRGSSKQQLKLGIQVESLEEDDTSVRVRFSDGSADRYAAVFDSRPVKSVADPGSNSVTLLQQFVGLHVRSENNMFSPGCAVMMDFRESGEDTIQFMYVLPYSSREALVEATVFTKTALNSATLVEGVFAYLGRLGSCGDIQIVHREQGCIPMTTRRIEARPSKRVIRIGAAGGAVKPSTGYAFGAIQKMAESISEQLVQGVPAADVISPVCRQRKSVFLDDVFLCYLARYPQKAPELFRRIFQRCPGDRIARFLTDTGSIVDDLCMIASMPKFPFILEALRSYPIWYKGSRSKSCPRKVWFHRAMSSSTAPEKYIPSLR
jgi:lycopene beta-cyclase